MRLIRRRRIKANDSIRSKVCCLVPIPALVVVGRYVLILAALWFILMNEHELSGYSNVSLYNDTVRDSIRRMHTEPNTTTVTKQSKDDVDNIDERRPCYVVVENKVDVHHEVLESIVLRYPLPFDKFNDCTTSKPIIYDFNLFQNRFFMKIPGKMSGSGAPNAKFLNETEFWGWKKYFETKLQHKTFDRNDGQSNILTTKAYFNELIPFEELNQRASKADAIIDASCDMGTKFITKIKKDNTFFCVLHGSNEHAFRRYPRAREKCCYLSPMYDDDQCTFLAADLPKFDNEISLASSETSEIKICGTGYRFEIVAEMFSKILYLDYNVKLYYYSREDPKKVNPIFKSFGVPKNRYSIDKELDYETYYKKIAQCDITINLHEPSTSPKYYPWGGKKSSGLVPALVAYNLPAVLHQEFAKIYAHLLTAPYETYQDSMDSKIEALKRMVVKIHGMKEGI